MFLHIAIPRPLEEVLVYRCPPDLEDEVMVGKRAIVPLKTQKVTGFIVDTSMTCPPSLVEDRDGIKSIIRIIDTYPVIDRTLLTLSRWASEYYIFPLGMVLKIALSIIPEGKPPRPPERIHSLLRPLRNEIKDKKMSEKYILTPYQEEAVKCIKESLHQGEFSVFLLHGVTGSGKTEVYIRAVDECRKRGRSSIVLVPEISITPQLITRFISHFGERVAVLHSGLTRGERLAEWIKIKEKGVDVVIGVRSAVFAPLENPGLIIVDEEHEHSYKQEDGFRYNARDVAIMRAKLSDSTVILGSATPSLETLYNVRRRKYKCLSLPARINRRPLPPVRIVDMRKKEGFSLLTEELIDAIRTRIEKREQVVLFLNRRGFARFLLCLDCGYSPSCPNCSVSLVYHKGEKRLCCHYCEYRTDLPDLCPMCRGERFKALGAGTERMAEDLKKIFPNITVLRMDRDTIGKRHAHHFILTRMENREADILIGTQMVTKGLDLPEITLAGVLFADNMLHLPDFRSAERTFQLITQVAGRTGRGKKPGEVIVQTFNPSHYSILHAARYEFDKFCESEEAYRNATGYPPFKRLIRILIKGNKSETVASASERFKDILHENKNKGMDIAGPVPAPFSKLRGKYRWHILVKGDNTKDLNRVVRKSLHLFSLQGGRGIQIEVDVDPLSLL